MQEKAFRVSEKFMGAEKNPIILDAQAVITMTKAFEVYQTDVLEKMP